MITFPSSPVDGQIYAIGNVKYTYSSSKNQWSATTANENSKYANNVWSGTNTFSGNVTVGAYTLPLTAGTTGQSLVVNGSGNIVWGTPASGSVTSVGGTGTVSGLTLSGNVTTNGNLTLGGTLSLTSGQITGGLGFTPYNATNPSGYISSITSANVVTALGFTPYNATNPSGYISSITSANVVTALGFTPYNATNPSGYITSSGNITGSAAKLSGGAANQLVYQSGASTTTFVTAPSTASTFLSWNGTAFVWATAGGGGSVSLTDDTSTNATYYPVLATTATGTLTAKASSTKLQYNPSTGVLSATIFNSLSDINVKMNVATLENASSIINQIRGVSFDWKDGTGSSYGVIAQEIEKVMPHAVAEADGLKSVNYSAIIGFLIETVKEQDLRIKSLEEKLNG